MKTRTWTLVLTSAASLMVALDILAVSTALTTIRQDLHASVGSLEWTVTAYNISLAVLLLPASALGDKFGRRRLFGAGLGLFTAASAGCALAPTIGWLVAARAVQGIGAALVLPLGLALVGIAYPAERRGRALGIAGGITGLATVAGPVLGGGLTQVFGWAGIFWLNVPIGAAAIVLVRLHIAESRGADTAVDLPGVTLGALAVLGIVWGLTGPPGPILVAGIVAAAAYAGREWRRAPYFRIRGFAVGNLATLLHGATVLGPVFLMAQLFQTGLGYGPLQAGLRLLPWTGTLLVAAPVAGTVADRIGQRPVMVAGFVTAAAGMAGFAVAAVPGRSYATLAVALTVWGIGNSMIFPAVQSVIVGAVPRDVIGTATGTNQMIREVGGVLGIAVLAAVFAGSGGYGSAGQFLAGCTPALLVCAAVALASAVVSLAVPGRHASLVPAAPAS